MRVKILRSTVADGKDVYAGKIYEISDRDAKLLIQMGKAVEVKEEKITEEKAVKKGGK